MSAPVKAIYYDGVTSRPQEALVSVREPNTLEAVLEDNACILWPLEHKGMQWERSSSTLRLSFGEHPRKVLIIQDELFIRSFAQRMRFTGRQGVYDRTLSAARKGPIVFFLGVVALMVSIYFWVLPWAAERIAMMAPHSLDDQLGEAAFEQMRLGLDIDTERSEKLQAFGDRVRLGREHTLTFHVVNSSEINAFALPGGHIVVFTGLLDRIEGPEALAALLAHESTHVEERHSTRMMVRNLSGYLFLSLLIGDVNSVVAVVADNANSIRNMGYGRGLETEADTIGQRRMAESGMDPAGMVQLLRLLDDQAHDMPEALSFLSSHPLTADRIAVAEQHARELGAPISTPDGVEDLFKALAADSTAAGTE